MGRIQIAIFLASMTGLVVSCSRYNVEDDLASCRYELEKLPQKSNMKDDAQFHFVDVCIQAKGWKPSEQCIKFDAAGTWICDYERR